MSKDQFSNLLNVSGELCVSIYMPVVPNVRENITRLKFLVVEANRQVRKIERRASAELVAWTKRLDELPDQITWEVGRKTLCVFARMGQVEYFFVPLVMVEEVNVGRHHKLGPLVALFDLAEPFYVLELRQDQPRLYRGGRQEFVELEMPKIQITRIARPAELNRERSVDKLPDRFPPAQLSKFLKQVAREAAALVKPAGSVVIPVGTEALVETFREDLCGLNLTRDSIRLKPGEGQLTWLYEQALAVMDGLRDRRLDSLGDEFRALAAQEDRASGVAVEVFQAARQGRVRELMFAYGTGVRDSEVFREQLLAAEEAGAGDYYDEIVEAAIRETLRNGGQVHALPQDRMPVASRVAAVYRY